MFDYILKQVLPPYPSIPIATYREEICKGVQLLAVLLGERLKKIFDPPLTTSKKSLTPPEVGKKNVRLPPIMCNFVTKLLLHGP